MQWLNSKYQLWQPLYLICATISTWPALLSLLAPTNVFFCVKSSFFAFWTNALSVHLEMIIDTNIRRFSLVSRHLRNAEKPGRRLGGEGEISGSRIPTTLTINTNDFYRGVPHLKTGGFYRGSLTWKAGRAREIPCHCLPPSTLPSSPRAMCLVGYHHCYHATITINSALTITTTILLNNNNLLSPAHPVPCAWSVTTIKLPCHNNNRVCG